MGHDVLVRDIRVVGLGGASCGSCDWRSDNSSCSRRTSDNRGDNRGDNRSGCCYWTSYNGSCCCGCCGCGGSCVDGVAASAESTKTIVADESVPAGASSPVGVDDHVVVAGTDLAASASVIVGDRVGVGWAGGDALVAVDQGLSAGLAHSGRRHSETDVADPGSVHGEESIESQIEVGAHVDVEVHWASLAVDDGGQTVQIVRGLVDVLVRRVELGRGEAVLAHSPSVGSEVDQRGTENEIVELH